MTEDHSWAGDTRLIPPDGASVPSQHEETRGTPNREARGGDICKEAASFSSNATNVKKTPDDQKEEAGGTLLKKRTLDDI